MKYGLRWLALRERTTMISLVRMGTEVALSLYELCLSL